MNVLELVSQGIKGKNWTIEEKAYYIYLQSCLLFSYDPRYDFCELLSDERKLQNEIKNREIDLENVQDNRVICTSHSREVLSQLLKQLLDIEPLLRGQGHAWCVFNDGCREIDADATVSSDIARVKMGLNTYGYKSVCRDYNYNNQLKQISKKVRYIEEEYTNYFLEERKKGLFEEFVSSSYSDQPSASSDDFLIYKLYTVKELFDSFSQLQCFSDASFTISYLMRKFLDKDIVNTVSLFQKYDDDNWNFINLYPVQLENDMIYFMLEDGKDGLSFYEITETDAVNYAKNLRGIHKELIYSHR